MEGGGSSGSSCSFMATCNSTTNNNNSNNTSMMMMMINKTNNNPQTFDNKMFLPLSWSSSTSNNNNNNNVQTQTPLSTFLPQPHTNNSNDHDAPPTSTSKAKIMAHPLFPRLLTAYVNCQKVGAPPEVVARLEQACAVATGSCRAAGHGNDPALDQFMEAYCEMLTKYEQELTKPFKEAMLFFSRIESQLKAQAVSSDGFDLVAQNDCSKEIEVDMNENYIDPQAEVKELKGQLLRKYSGYLGSLKQEFLKKKKNGKLPKEARQQLLDWWSRHYKWPYPSESQKVALAESTGLDLKQINNWFINQRKRHWKPTEDMQFVVMDTGHPHYYLDNVICNPFSMDCSSSHF
ncbi:hypothetical protein IC582_000477 [Cucumis melo]|uniref:Homeobox protein knotted-1-like LET6 n=1 Tax=Cucumis melo TaxID=3656 RepID=A0A1S3C0Z5_CUCME|nr:homeobox protein knotted-1-like LET6 [Cucumis melo]